MGDVPLYKKIALAVGAIALFGCVISTIRLVERRRLAGKVGEASAEPEDITLAKLIARGPDGNANVHVTDLEFDKQYLTRTFKTKSGVEGVKHIWAVARVPGEAPGGPVRVLVKNTNVPEQSDADRFLTTRSVKGLVINKIDRPDDEEVGLLRSKYPGFDPDKVVMIEVGREPPGQVAMFNLYFSLIAGFIAFACVVVMFWDCIPGLLPRRKKKKRRRRTVDDED
jgi:hypothetical protein